jgi:hypothetical protein
MAVGFQYGQKSIWETRPDAVDTLRECIALRMSASETAAKMAAAFGVPVTANMCVAKARRLKMRFDSQSSHNTFAKHGQGKARPSRAAPSVPPAPKPIRIAIAAPEKLVEPPHGRGLPIIALTRRECRWPTGLDEEGRHLFCGEVVSEATLDSGRCYCAGHARLACRMAQTRQITPEHRRAMLAGKTKAQIVSWVK